MAIEFFIPSMLTEFSDGASRVRIEASPATVGEALDLLWHRHPGIRDRVVTERGEVRPHVNVFVTDENIRCTGGLGTPIPSGAAISIIPAVSGG
ncbi:MAG: molybdopterin synthase sulfur carrier subunit [Candidatus Eisenbacteria bacterium]|uniref:Molybdopterin synthase sulfur carrier subunit n=1 Tax=Eiseniibacteriota bacterium TaxID=2212470 RepID=A0A849SK54_UNCEI|nr:molybdopterin synthase sulfur carrier subunit [Candidatus Eisenbacteria bacterium]